MKSGVVVRWVSEKGFGFICAEQKRIFCHISAWSEVEEPVVGQHVTFETAPARNSGMPDQAVNVRPEQIGDKAVQ